MLTLMLFYFIQNIFSPDGREVGEIIKYTFCGTLMVVISTYIITTCKITILGPLIWTFPFFCWLSLSYIFTTNLERSKEYLIGSTGGILFFFSVGFSISIIKTIFLRERRLATQKNEIYKNVLLICLNIFFILSYLNYLEFKNLGVLESFQWSSGDYQRRGIFLIIANIFVLNFLIFNQNIKKQNFNFYLNCFFILHFILASILIAQSLRSNIGAIVISGFLIIYWFYLLSNLSSRQKFFLQFFITILVATTSLFYFREIQELSNHLRIFGYGEGFWSIVAPRLEILQNFWPQMSYNILFGNLDVDKITGQPGSYAHSIILNIISHLGLLGLITFLFIGLPFLSNLKNILLRDPITKLNFYIFALIFILGCLTQSMHWAPFWFQLAILLFNIKQQHNSRVDNRATF